MKNVIEVIRNPHGWWDVRLRNGDVIGRYVSEFQACEAGRSAAVENGADLAIFNEGTTPRVEMLDPRTGALKAIAVQTQPSPPANGRQLVLLVEDMVDARELYALYLTYTGFSVVTAINGHEALRLARMLRPDVILMDVRLPGMDGLEATADLKADPELKHIPIIAITADASTEVAERARAAGCDAFVSKPALPDAVAQTITSVLNGRRGGASRASS